MKHTLLMLLAVFAVAAGGILGCEQKAPEDADDQSDEKQPAGKRPAATGDGVAATLPTLSATGRDELVGAVEMLPADMIVHGTCISPAIMVENLNALLGPEVPALISSGMALLPARALDFHAPMAWAVTMGQPVPHVVAVMKLRDVTKLIPAEPQEGDVMQLMMPDGSSPMPVFAKTEGDWILLGSSEMAIRMVTQNEKKLEVDDAMARRMADNISWMRVNLEVLSMLARPAVQGEMRQLEQRHGTAEARLQPDYKLLQWADAQLGDARACELICSFNADKMACRAGLQMKEGAQLIKVAESLKPIGSYGGVLPASDRLLEAGYGKIDWNTAVPELKTWLEPIYTMALAELDKQIAAAKEGAGPDAAEQTAVLTQARESIRTMWSALDSVPKALGDDFAYLIESPEEGDLLTVTEVISLRDSTVYRAMLKDTVSSFGTLFDEVEKAMPEGPGQPKMSFVFDLKEDVAEIDGVSVDQARFDLNMQMPKGMPPVPSMNTMKHLYGPEGMTMYLAYLDNHLVACSGSEEDMARAIAAARGEGDRLAADPAVAEALKRVPTDAGLVSVASMPRYCHMYAALVETMMTAGIPESYRENLEAVPAPEMAWPAVGELAVGGITAGDGWIWCEMDLPKSEVLRAVDSARYALSRGILYGIPYFIQMQNQMMQMEMGTQGGMMGHGVPPEPEPGELVAPTPSD